MRRLFANAQNQSLNLGTDADVAVNWVQASTHVRLGGVSTLDVTLISQIIMQVACRNYSCWFREPEVCCSVLAVVILGDGRLAIRDTAITATNKVSARRYGHSF